MFSCAVRTPPEHMWRSKFHADCAVVRIISLNIEQLNEVETDLVERFDGSTD